MNHKIKSALKAGYNEIVRAGHPNLEFIEFGVLNLAAGKSFEAPAQAKETVGVVLSGCVNVSGEGFEWPRLGKRANVFAGPATGFYVPCGRAIRIEAAEEASVALAKAPSDLDSAPVCVRPEDVIVKKVGRHNWLRHVHDIVDMRVRAKHLVVGETFNPPGNWSSFPPHRHDFDNLPEEVNMEEVYYFKVMPRQGFGMQRIYTDDRKTDAAYVIEDGDTTIMPEGYHPVAAGAGYQLYYLWILAGRQRILRPRDDPNHAWLKSCEAVLDGVRP